MIFLYTHNTSGYTCLYTFINNTFLYREGKMAGKFEIYKDKKGEFRFRLKASNGENILASEGYKSKSSCKNGIDCVKKNAKVNKLFERKTTKNGKTYFVLKARNHQIVGVSERYNTEKSMENGIASVGKHASSAKIDDLC